MCENFWFWSTSVESSHTPQYLYNNNKAEKGEMKLGYHLTLNTDSLWLVGQNTIKYMFMF